MATTSKWTDVGTLTTVIAGGATAPTLKNKTNNAYTLSNEIDPGTVGFDQLASYRLKLRATTPTKGVVAKCWFVKDLGDDGNYDITDGTNTPDRAPDFVFNGYAITTQQYLESVPAVVLRPAHPFKVLHQNVSGATTTNVDGENELAESVFNDQQV